VEGGQAYGISRWLRKKLGGEFVFFGKTDFTYLGNEKVERLKQEREVLGVEGEDFRALSKD